MTQVSAGHVGGHVADRESDLSAEEKERRGAGGGGGEGTAA